MRLFEYLLKRFIDYKTKYPLEYIQSFDIIYRLVEKEYVGYFLSERLSTFSVEVQNLKLSAGPCINIMNCAHKASFQTTNVGNNVTIFCKMWGGNMPFRYIEMFCTLFQYKYNEKHRWLIPEEAIDADSMFDIRIPKKAEYETSILQII